MTKIRIISKLWSVIDDMKMLINGSGRKSVEEIDRELDVIEMHCRKYCDADDFEI